MSPRTARAEDEMKTPRYEFTIHSTHYRVDDPPQPPPPDDDVIRQARIDADAAKAEAARLKREMDEIRKAVPSEEQRARWAELEERDRKAEEEKAKAAGNFDEWRRQINEKHAKDMDAERQMRENAAAQAAAIERDLQNTLVGQEFAKASDLFGPTGKTVLLPEVAQSYFASNVEVEVVAAANGGPSGRRVVVKDHHGAVILDPKNGKPMPFAAAMAQLIDTHPQKAHLLRGSGKVGSNTTGGAHGGQDLDLSRLKAGDFADPAVRAAVRANQANAGGLQMGPAFDRMKPTRGK